MPIVAVERSPATRVVGLGAAATLTDNLRRTAARGAALLRLGRGQHRSIRERQFDCDNHGEQAALLDAADRGPVSGP